MNMMKVALAAHILVETKGENARAIKTLTGWGKQYLSNLLVPEGWYSGKVGLVLAYLVIYNKQVQKIIEGWKMEQPIERVQVSEHSPLGNTEIEEKGLQLRVADRMEAFTSVVAGMVDEIEKRVKECVQVSKDTGEKVKGVVKRMAAERVSEERRQKGQVKAQKEREKTKTTTTTQSV
jgi:hypothetical protein